jgi:hypothetical protein
MPMTMKSFATKNAEECPAKIAMAEATTTAVDLLEEETSEAAVMQGVVPGMPVAVIDHQLTPTMKLAMTVITAAALDPVIMDRALTGAPAGTARATVLRLAAILGALVAKQRDHHKVLHQATKDKAATDEEMAGTRVDATGIRDQALQRENSLTRHLPRPRSPTLPLPLRPLLHLRQTLRAKAKAKREMAKARAKAKAKDLRCNQMGHHGLRHDHAGITLSVTEKAAPSSTMPGQPTPSLGLPQPPRRRRRLLLLRRHLPLRPRRAPDEDEEETTHPTLRERNRQHSTSI